MGFNIRNSAQGWSPESVFHVLRIHNPDLDSEILSVESKIQDCLRVMLHETLYSGAKVSENAFKGDVRHETTRKGDF